MTITGLGKWEGRDMVQRYTRSVTFEESPLGRVTSGECWFSLAVPVRVA